MIGFTAQFVLRSMRWVAPFLVVVVWVVGALSAGGSTGFELASVLFPAYLVAGAWLTIITGNIDDDAHRDLLAAAIGSPTRLHLWRAITVLVMASVVAVVVAGGVAVMAEPGRSPVVVVGVTFTVSAAAVLIGLGIGTFLHRPLLRHRGLSVLTATAGCIVVMLLPPIQSAHRALNDDRVSGAYLLLVGAAIWAAVSCLCASQLVARRSR